MTQPRRQTARLETLEPRKLFSAAARIVAYFPEYRSSLINTLDFTKFTHLNYFDVVANSDGSLNTANISLTHMATLVTKAHAAHDTISITVGPEQFDTIANNATALNTFVTNIINFTVTNKLDGIDIDWEPPSGTSAPVYKTFLDALFAQTHPRGLLLTEAVNPVTHEVPLSAIGDLDWLNVMGYNFTLTDPSGLAESESAMASWASYGVPASKLVLGLPFYGLGPSSYGDAQTYSDLQSYYASTHSGALAGPSVDDIVYSNGHDYKFNGVTTVTNKTNYVVNNSYGGIMIWELGQDHYSGSTYDQYSLLPAITTAMSSSLLAIPATPASPSIADNSSIAARPTVLDWADATSATSYGVYVDGNFVQSVTTSQFTLPSSLVLTPNVAHTWQIVSINASHRSSGPVWHFTINPIAGDANLDGIVNSADFTVMASNFEKTGMTWMSGDFNGDGNVNALDFNAIATNFGNVATAAALSSSASSTSPFNPSTASSVASLFGTTAISNPLAADLFSSTSVL